jgi:hypothetical protein
MASVNAIVGGGIYGSDRIIISKTTLNNNSIRYDIEFDFIPTSYNIYSWYDEYHTEFSNLIDLFSSVGSKIIQDENKWVLVGPKISLMSSNSEMYIRQWDDNPFLLTYEDQPIFICDKSPYQVFIDELGFYPGQNN